MNGIKLEKRVTSFEEYKSICDSVGWNSLCNDKETIIKSLENSIFGITVLNDLKEPIGMGRIVGDGYLYFYFQDISVNPKYQNQGIGSLILDELINYIIERKGEICFTGLFATEKGIDLYKKYSFDQRDMIGMFTVKDLIIDKLNQEKG